MFFRRARLNHDLISLGARQKCKAIFLGGMSSPPPLLAKEELLLGNFSPKKILGKGSSGKAELVVCESNQQQYAMKTIEGVFDEEHGVQERQNPCTVFMLTRVDVPNVPFISLPDK